MPEITKITQEDIESILDDVEELRAQHHLPQYINFEYLSHNIFVLTVESGISDHGISKLREVGLNIYDILAKRQVSTKMAGKYEIQMPGVEIQLEYIGRHEIRLLH